MNSKRPLAPKFLNKLDDHLLLHKPETWSARTHLVVYYGLLFMAVLAGLCFIVPNDARSSSPIAYWIGFLVIIDIIALVAWMIFLLRFNVFKRFGNITPVGRLKTFALYFVSVGTIVLFTYVPPVVETARANMAYSDAEIYKDVNSINSKICQLEYDSLKHEWNADTVVVVNKIQTQPTVYHGDTMIPVTHPAYRVMDTTDFAKKKKELDSIVKLDDSTYALYECPDYRILKLYNYSGIIQTTDYRVRKHDELMTSENIFDSIIRHYKAPNKEAVTKELYALIRKYEYNEYDRYNSYEVDPTNGNETFWQKTEKKYSINNISRSIEHIMDRKHRWNDSNLPWQIRLFFYFTLVFTLLVFIFRHSTTKTFFLSLLVGVILSILTSLMIAFSSGNGESTVYGCLLFYTMLFGAIALTSFTSKTRTLVSGISTNLFVLMVNFFPLWIACYYYSLIEKSRYNEAIRAYEEFDYASMYRNIFIAEVTGFVILLVLLPTLIHKLYRKWFALPQE